MKQFLSHHRLALVPLRPAAEVIPPVPKEYFNDYAKVVSPATAQRVEQTLENFEQQTSSQILVAIYPKMQTDSSIEDYTVRVFQAWKPGQKDKNNGAVLFVFVAGPQNAHCHWVMGWRERCRMRSANKSSKMKSRHTSNRAISTAD